MKFPLGFRNIIASVIILLAFLMFLGIAVIFKLPYRSVVFAFSLSAFFSIGANRLFHISVFGMLRKSG